MITAGFHKLSVKTKRTAYDIINFSQGTSKLLKPNLPNVNIDF